MKLFLLFFLAVNRHFCEQADHIEADHRFSFLCFDLTHSLVEQTPMNSSRMNQFFTNSSRMNQFCQQERIPASFLARW